MGKTAGTAGITFITIKNALQRQLQRIFCAIVLLFGCYKGEIKNRYDFNIENNKAIITEVFKEPDCTNAVEIMPIKISSTGL